MTRVRDIFPAVTPAAWQWCGGAWATCSLARNSLSPRPDLCTAPAADYPDASSVIQREDGPEASRYALRASVALAFSNKIACF